MMGGRRFLNVMVYNGVTGVDTLRRIDLLSRRHKLFKTPSPPPAAAANTNGGGWGHSEQQQEEFKLGTIRLPAPVVSFHAAGEPSSPHVDCFPVAGAGGRKVLAFDHYGRTTLLFDTVTRQVSMDMPCPHDKCLPVAIFVPGADGGDHGSSIYVMATRPHREDHSADHLSHQYEAFTYRSSSAGWQRQLLPPPPFVVRDHRDVDDDRPTINSYACGGRYVERPDITSYAVLHGAAAGNGGAPAICVSANRDAGTYCLDTATHTWTKLGDWTMPFTGKVEYVPELKLWFGIVHGGGSRDWQLGAADLSTMGSQQPQLVGTWKELEPLPQWWAKLTRPQFIGLGSCDVTYPQLVSLGSGRFCVARLICHSYIDPMDLLCLNSHKLVQQDFFTLFTGVDFVPLELPDHHTSNNVDDSGGNGSEVQLQMIRHKSMRHMGEDIRLVF